MSLTDTALKALKPKEASYIVSDDRGLYVEVPPSSSIVWRKKEQGFDAAAGQVRGLLKRMFDYALTCGLIQANPVMVLPMRHGYRAAAVGQFGGVSPLGALVAFSFLGRAVAP